MTNDESKILNEIWAKRNAQMMELNLLGQANRLKIVVPISKKSELLEQVRKYDVAYPFNPNLLIIWGCRVEFSTTAEKITAEKN